jgi:hypothetical protein
MERLMNVFFTLNNFDDDLILNLKLCAKLSQLCSVLFNPL